MGFRENAKNGLDDFDIFSPPSEFCNLDMVLYNTEVEGNACLKKEYRENVGEGQEFQFNLKNTTGEQTKLIISRLKNFEHFEICLVDKGNMSFYDLKEVNEFDIRGSVRSRDYSLLIGNDAYIKNKKILLQPKDYILYQNYPNPFNPVTSIRFAIPEIVNVELKIFDILGREVKSLINNETRTPGYYEVQFDAGNLTSGVYFYRISAGKYKGVRKMILLR